MLGYCHSAVTLHIPGGLAYHGCYDCTSYACILQVVGSLAWSGRLSRSEFQRTGKSSTSLSYGSMRFVTACVCTFQVTAATSFPQVIGLGATFNE